ncbi:hypothetical protein [Streptomyces harbinensis]|uniref:hypothetical protein n=1 Tax=Streptomyces harbinensis TaxID=1176198 RepID=UPI00367781A1
MNTTPGPPHITLHRDDRQPHDPTYTPPLQPTHGTQLTPQQMAVIAALIHQNTPTPTAVPHTTPDPNPVTQRDTRVSGKAKDIALITAGGGAGVGVATTGIGYGSGLIASASGGLMTAALALAITTGSIGALLLMLRATRKTAAEPEESASQRPVQHITQNIHSSGMFGRANGTINR